MLLKKTTIAAAIIALSPLAVAAPSAVASPSSSLISNFVVCSMIRSNTNRQMTDTRILSSLPASVASTTGAPPSLTASRADRQASTIVAEDRLAIAARADRYHARRAWIKWNKYMLDNKIHCSH